LANDDATTGAAFAPPPTSKELRSTARLHHQQIRVSPAVLDAARKDSEVLLRDLGTSGLRRPAFRKLRRKSGRARVVRTRSHKNAGKVGSVAF
jgi:hypothetical protein